MQPELCRITCTSQLRYSYAASHDDGLPLLELNNKHHLINHPNKTQKKEIHVFSLISSSPYDAEQKNELQVIIPIEPLQIRVSSPHNPLACMIIDSNVLSHSCWEILISRTTTSTSSSVLQFPYCPRARSGGFRATIPRASLLSALNRELLRAR